MISNVMQRSIQVNAGFLVYRDPVCACLGKCRNEFVGILDHQVAIQRAGGCFAERLDDRRPNGEVGDEMPVHDVDMDHGRSALRSALHLLAEVGEIR
jgi:hypothetical protein